MPIDDLETIEGTAPTLIEIAGLTRNHIEIRNRSWMKQIHRDCFLGSDAVTFMVEQGFADSRAAAVILGQSMMEKKLLKHVVDSRRKFRDAYMYYRFTEDDNDNSVLSQTNAGNGADIHLGQSGCKFSFAPHTAHNSFVLDVALAEELERVVAGASIEARANTFAKLRERVREQASPDAENWVLCQSTEFNKVSVNVYERIRPRGDFKNVRMTGVVGQTPKSFIAGMMDFSRRSLWDSMFEDGVMVESINLGADLVLSDAAPGTTIPNSPRSNKLPNASDAENPTRENTAGRGEDDIDSFLETVDLAGIPPGMSVAYLNDLERQAALAHLRKQMLQSKPKDCMRCEVSFGSAADIRFCPCCATVSCPSCVSRRVFEVASRQVVSLCSHCWRNSSRIRHPPDALTGPSVLTTRKWWKMDDLQLPDFSNTDATTASVSAGSANTSQIGSGNNSIEVPGQSMTPLLAGLMDDIESGVTSADDKGEVDGLHTIDESAEEGSDNDDADPVSPRTKKNVLRQSLTRHLNAKKVVEPPTSTPASEVEAKNEEIPKSGPQVKKPTPESIRMARCKRCGELIDRSIEAIETHEYECAAAATQQSPRERKGSIIGTISNALRSASLAFRGDTNSESPTVKDRPKLVGGITRRPDLEKRSETRIIYRTGRLGNKSYKLRDVCALQDAFMDPDGTYYCYEVSVRHCDARGSSDCVTSDVMLLMYVARPSRSNKSMANITIVSQVDSRAKDANWWPFAMINKDRGKLVAAKKEDLIRELRACGNLQNILPVNVSLGGADATTAVGLDDFELLAVLGRGGFGKVMQVKHRPTGMIYAMKSLKKTELRRRKQIERTQTERTILAAVSHPFIVRLHFAFQSPAKLYMVMDFVQGGDFFTLMRKFRKLPEEWVRLYIAEIAMALQHLHDMDVVYRDLKPENILLCGDGHLKLTDFGLSRFFEMRPPAPEDIVGEDNVLTRSFCGTEQYMSPEMLLQQGHNHRMDWWCVGLLMHEMITARHPFHGPTHYDTLRNMVSSQPKLDSRLSLEASSVIKGMLVKNPLNRLCCKKGCDELKGLTFFATLDWDALYNRQIRMPYQPELSDAMDLSSFETQFTREAAVDSVAEDAEGGSSRKSGSSKTGKSLFSKLFGSGSSMGAATTSTSSSDGFENFAFSKPVQEIQNAGQNDTENDDLPAPLNK